MNETLGFNSRITNPLFMNQDQCLEAGCVRSIITQVKKWKPKQGEAMMRNPGRLPTDLLSLFRQIQSPSLMPCDATEHQLQPSFSPLPMSTCPVDLTVHALLTFISQLSHFIPASLPRPPPPQPQHAPPANPQTWQRNRAGCLQTFSSLSVPRSNPLVSSPA